MLDRIKVQLRLFFAEMTITKILIIGVVAIAFLLIVRVLFLSGSTEQGRFPGTPLNSVDIGQTASYEVTPPREGASDQRSVLRIYTEDSRRLTGTQTDQLINAALRESGYERSQVYILLNPEDGFSSEAEFPEQNQSFDPTDPLSTPDYNPNIVFEENQEAEAAESFGNGVMTFSEWVEVTRPANFEYEIYKESEYAYLVVIKQNYSIDQFEQDVLTNFDNTDELVFEYQLEEEFWFENP